MLDYCARWQRGAVRVPLTLPVPNMLATVGHATVKRAAPPSHCEAPLLRAAGYQWKTLFLPEGTQLRMSRGERTYTAQVEGDYIMFEGRKVSPRGMTVAIADDGGSAWRDLWLRLPGERFWGSPIRCRREAARHSIPAAPSAAESMQAAADAMSNALHTALALVELARPPVPPDPGERRLGSARRAGDVFGEDCPFYDEGEVSMAPLGTRPA